MRSRTLSRGGRVGLTLFASVLTWSLAGGALAIATVGSPGVARADEVVFEKHTVVDFGDDTIDGNLSKPDGQYLEARKKQKQIRLIKVRESFRAEILQSVRAL